MTLMKGSGLLDEVDGLIGLLREQEEEISVVSMMKQHQYPNVPLQGEIYNWGSFVLIHILTNLTYRRRNPFNNCKKLVAEDTSALCKVSRGKNMKKKLQIRYL